MRYLKKGRLYCFSPPVMMATFLIEVFLAFYVLARYKLNAVTRLAAAILLFLAIFQLAEYNVCEGAWGLGGMDWARMGYVAITFLPPLGFHLATHLIGRPQWRWTLAAYGAATIFAIIFLFVGQGMQGHECMGNYVIFQIAPWAVKWYTFYYYGAMIATIGYCLYVAKEAPKHKKYALLALVLGYVGFILPTTFVNLIDASTLAGIPSIMCGFAVVLALVLSGLVLPNYFDRAKK